MAVRVSVESAEASREMELVRPYPIHWSELWVGALSTLAVGLLAALVATAIGGESAGTRLGPEDLGLGDLVASVCGAFFSFAVGGWVTARLAGVRRAEPAMVHGAFVWLLSIPLLIALLSLSAGAYVGSWYSGLVANAPSTSVTGAEAAEFAREAAGGGATALLIGLVGAVLGGWLGSGEAMDPRNRRVAYKETQ